MSVDPVALSELAADYAATRPHAWVPFISHEATRAECIAWLCWCDPNGTWTDGDSIAEGSRPLTLSESREYVRQFLTEE